MFSPSFGVIGAYLYFSPSLIPEDHHESRHELAKSTRVTLLFLFLHPLFKLVFILGDTQTVPLITQFFARQTVNLHFQVEGALVEVSVSGGNVWGVNSAGQIWRFNGQGWNQATPSS